MRGPEKESDVDNNLESHLRFAAQVLSADMQGEVICNLESALRPELGREGCHKEELLL